MKIGPIVAALLALAWSTTFSACVLPPVGDAVIRCAAGDVCPDGLRCVQGASEGTCRTRDAACVVDVEGVAAEAADGTACSEGICLRGACVAPACGDGLVTVGETCDGDRDDCRSNCTRCGDGVVDANAGEACDKGEGDGGNSDTAPGACRTTCVDPVCGDGVIDPGETCDGVDCRGDCTRCGDGIIDASAGEACDEGDGDDGNSDIASGACRTTCVLPVCGDGVTDPGETCDGVGCRGDCTRCGDGVIDAAAGEGCDDGARNSDRDAGACRISCTPSSCGDGVIDPGEGCDDGAANSDGLADACRTNCSRSRCGDGVKDAAEGCDDGVTNGVGADACRPTCVAASCGDGIIDTGEGCDFGNANSDVQPNACRRTCVPSSCGDSIRDVEDECDNGPDNSDTAAGACRTTCVLPACGDGVVDRGEACDDANDVSGDGCRGDCAKSEECGDRVIDAGEVCDDGNDNPRDGCNNACASTFWAIGTPATVAGRDSSGVTALTSPQGVEVDGAGGVYVADTGGHRVLRLDPSGAVEVIAGTGAAGFSGDDGPAIAAELRGPTDVALSSTGLIFIADQLNDRVRVIDRGVIRTFAGGVIEAPGDGDGKVATAARLRRPRALAVDQDRLLIAEEEGRRVRAVGLVGNVISTEIGGGASGAIPDGPDLRIGSLLNPTDLALVGGTLFIVEAGQQLLRRVNLTAGTIDTLAGGGTAAPPVDGTIDSKQVGFLGLIGVSATATSVVLTDRSRREVYEVVNQDLRTVVSASPNLALFLRPAGVFATPAGEFFIVDEGRHTCVRIDATGRPDTIIGTGLPGLTNEGALATTVTLVGPTAVAPATADHAMLVADAGARRLYAIDAAGHVRTFAGTGDVGAPGPGLAANQPLTPLQVARRGNGAVVVIATGGDLKSEVVLEYSPDGANVSILPVTLSPSRANFAGVGGAFEVVDVEFSRAVAPHLLMVADRVVVTVGTKVLVEGLTGDFTTLTLDQAILTSALADVGIVVLTSDGAVSGMSLTDPPVLTPLGTLSTTAVSLVLQDGIFLSGHGGGKFGLIEGLDNQDPFVAPGDGRSGDGGPPGSASVALPVALVSEGPGRLLIVDRDAGRVRRLTTTAGVSTVDTVVGDIHPPGPGTLAAGSLYAARTIALRTPQSLIVGGAAGRLLEVRLTGDPLIDGVNVIAGHPTPSPAPNEPLLRFQPLLHDAAAFFVSSSGFKMLDRSRLLAIVTTEGARDRWSFTATPAPDEFNTPSVFIAPLGDQILVSAAQEACVRPFNLDTGVVGDALFGVCGTAGSFTGLVRDPGPVTVAASGAIYLADTGNHRVLRRDPATGAVSVVIGDGSPSSAGQGGPAGIFPVNAPGQLAVDSAGNLFIASSTTVRLVANIDGDTDADADDDVSTIYGFGNRDAFPESESRCIAALALDEDNDRLFVADACAGFIVQLDLEVQP